MDPLVFIGFSNRNAAFDVLRDAWMSKINTRHISSKRPHDTDEDASQVESTLREAGEMPPNTTTGLTPRTHQETTAIFPKNLMQPVFPAQGLSPRQNSRKSSIESVSDSASSSATPSPAVSPSTSMENIPVPPTLSLSPAGSPPIPPSTAPPLLPTGPHTIIDGLESRTQRNKDSGPNPLLPEDYFSSKSVTMKSIGTHELGCSLDVFFDLIVSNDSTFLHYYYEARNEIDIHIDAFSGSEPGIPHIRGVRYKSLSSPFARRIKGKSVMSSNTTVDSKKSGKYVQVAETHKLLILNDSKGIVAHACIASPEIPNSDSFQIESTMLISQFRSNESTTVSAGEPHPHARCLIENFVGVKAISKHKHSTVRKLEAEVIQQAKEQFALYCNMINAVLTEYFNQADAALGIARNYEMTSSAADGLVNPPDGASDTNARTAAGSSLETLSPAISTTKLPAPVDAHATTDTSLEQQSIGLFLRDQNASSDSNDLQESIQRAMQQQLLSESTLEQVQNSNSQPNNQVASPPSSSATIQLSSDSPRTTTPAEPHKRHVHRRHRSSGSSVSSRGTSTSVPTTPTTANSSPSPSPSPRPKSPPIRHVVTLVGPSTIPMKPQPAAPPLSERIASSLELVKILTGGIYEFAQSIPGIGSVLLSVTLVLLLSLIVFSQLHADFTLRSVETELDLATTRIELHSRVVSTTSRQLRNLEQKQADRNETGLNAYRDRLQLLHDHLRSLVEIYSTAHPPTLDDEDSISIEQQDWSRLPLSVALDMLHAELVRMRVALHSSTRRTITEIPDEETPADSDTVMTMQHVQLVVAAISASSTNILVLSAIGALIIFINAVK